MNRRAFLKLFVGTVAVATIPIPSFLASKHPKLPVETPNSPSKLLVRKTSGDSSSGALTQETIEAACLAAAADFGRPDYIMMSKKDYKTFAKYFGYKVVYEGDETNIMDYNLW